MTDYSILNQKPDNVETIKVQCAHIFLNGVRYDTSNFPTEVYIKPIQSGPFDG